MTAKNCVIHWNLFVFGIWILEFSFDSFAKIFCQFRAKFNSQDANILKFTRGNSLISLQISPNWIFSKIPKKRSAGRPRVLKEPSKARFVSAKLTFSNREMLNVLFHKYCYVFFIKFFFAIRNKNPKSETRNAKQIQNSNMKIPKTALDTPEKAARTLDFLTNLTKVLNLRRVRFFFLQYHCKDPLIE